MLISLAKELGTERLQRFSETSPSKISSLTNKSLRTILVALLSTLSFSLSDHAHVSNKTHPTLSSTVSVTCLPPLATHRPGIFLRIFSLSRVA